MRVSQEEKNKTHRRIVEAAARLIRERGIDATSVSEVMSAAGLTHGGFYRHFKDKDALMAAALDEAFRERTASLIARFGDQSPQAAVAEYHGDYLQDGHLSALAIGCPVPTMAGDVARSPEQLKAAYGAQIREIVRILEQGIAGSSEERHRGALREIALLAGAIMIARASDPEMARDMLQSCR
jgi:TetR/AcrR family transcriptional repressor of nem operon